MKHKNCDLNTQLSRVCDWTSQTVPYKSPYREYEFNVITPSYHCQFTGYRQKAMTKHSMHGTLLHQCTHDRTLLPIKTGVHCSRIAPVQGWMLLRAKGPYTFYFLLQPNVFLKRMNYVTSFVTGISLVAVQQYRSADKSLARPGRKQATATKDFDGHISYL